MCLTRIELGEWFEIRHRSDANALHYLKINASRQWTLPNILAIWFWRRKSTTLIKDAVQSVCKQRLCLHFGTQNIEFYSSTIYIFMILEYNKLSRDNNQALQEHKMK